MMPFIFMHAWEKRYVCYKWTPIGCPKIFWGTLVPRQPYPQVVRKGLTTTI